MVSVIIPTYNDAQYLPEIIQVLKQVKEVSEIIVVDDGSDDKTSMQVLTELKNNSTLRLFAHKKNQGKAAALKTGFVESRGDVIVFMDADLYGLHPQHVRDLTKLPAEGKPDVAIGARKAGIDRLARFFSFYRLIGGDRCFRRQVLQENLDLFEVRGFAIELAMNQRFFGRYKVSFVELSGLGQHLKVKKYGLVKGLLGEVRMLREIVRGVGVTEIARQMRYADQLPYLKSCK